MAKMTQMPRFYIDDIEIQYVRSWEVNRDIGTEIGPFISDSAIYRINDTMTTIKIESAYMTIEAPIEYLEYTHDTEVRIYGPLRKAFPDLFIGRELSDWQLAYIKRIPGYRHKQELKYFRDNSIFDSKEAIWFEKGWKANESINKHK